MQHIDDAVLEFKSFKILHPSYHNALRTIKLSLRNSEAGKEAVSAMLVGDPGTGKTSVCQALEEYLGPASEQSQPGDVRKIIPCLYTRIPPRATIKGFAIKICEALGGREHQRGISSIEKRILTLLVTSKTRLMTFDEFNNLALKGAEKSQTSLCNWIKDLMDESRIPICLAGIPDSEQVVDANDQLPRRYPYRARLQNFEYSDLPSSDWVRVLAAFGQELQRVGEYQHCLPLTEPYCSKALYVHTGGNMSPLSLLLSSALRSTLERGSKKFTINDLMQEAAQLRSNTHLTSNQNAFVQKEFDLDNAIPG